MANIHQGPADFFDESEGVVTLEEAAKILNVSRSYMKTLLESGDLGPVRSTPEGQPLLSAATVHRYRSISRAERAAGLKKMVEATEKLGLYDLDFSKLPRKPRR